MARHELVDCTEVPEQTPYGRFMLIKAFCSCGWESKGFDPMDYDGEESGRHPYDAAQADAYDAFYQHKDRAGSRVKRSA